MVRGHQSPNRLNPALHGGVPRHSRFSEFLVCREGKKDSNLFASFVWPAKADTTGNLSVFGSVAVSQPLVSALASASAALGGAHGFDAGPHADVSMACVPFIAMGGTREDEERTAGDASHDPFGLSVRAQTLQRGVAGTCFAQASIATLQFALNDSISGLIGCAVAALGMQACSPSGYRFLPSYIVLAFCNGTMQLLIGTETAATQHMIAHGVGIKLAVAASLASPAVMFMGVAFAWHLQCELRRIAMLPPGARDVLPNQAPTEPIEASGSGGAIGRGGLQPNELFRPFVGQHHRLAETK